MRATVLIHWNSLRESLRRSQPAERECHLSALLRSPAPCFHQEDPRKREGEKKSRYSSWRLAEARVTCVLCMPKSLNDEKRWAREKLPNQVPMRWAWRSCRASLPFFLSTPLRPSHQVSSLCSFCSIFATREGFCSHPFQKTSAYIPPSPVCDHPLLSDYWSTQFACFTAFFWAQITARCWCHDPIWVLCHPYQNKCSRLEWSTSIYTKIYPRFL